MKLYHFLTVVIRFLYTVSHKERATKRLSVSSPNIDRFKKFFHWHTLRTICSNAIIKYTTTP